MKLRILMCPRVRSTTLNLDDLFCIYDVLLSEFVCLDFQVQELQRVNGLSVSIVDATS